MRNTIGIAVLLATSSPALAHALLQTASPPVGSEVSSAPSIITLDFSEAVEPRLSTVTVSAADGSRVDKRDLHTAPDDPKRLVLGLTRLANGTCTVVWHAVSVDKHSTEGSYHFTVGRE